ncbi:MAG TPA: hypothetical protein VFX92_02440, partial [Candidatus Krumholzibacteria bacterium]|nr:hypothetical protein [Candidatus Krumholzibacteria bacterium]
MRRQVRNVLTGFVLAGCVGVAAGGANAQDSQYWNLHYGTRGELISGVMVGSALDLSSTFYNPGAFARMDKPSVLLTGSVFAIQKIAILDQDPNEKAPTSSNTGPSPSMVAGLLPMKWFGGRTGYSFLTRQQMDVRLVARDGTFVGLDQPGDTLSIGGEAIFEQHMGEYWGGFTWATNLNDRFSVGTTLYGVYRSQRTRVQGVVQAFGADGFGAGGLTIREVDYWTGRALAKVGILGDFGKTRAGISFTTPGLHVAGSGNAEDIHSTIGDVDFDGTPDGAATVSYSEGQDAEFHSPASVALGLSYRFDAATIHATTEYFAAVDPYTVLTSPAPATGPGVTGITVDYEHAAKSVWNAGVGVEYRFSERGTAYGA